MTWFYKSPTGSEMGPVNPQELLELIRNGSVLRDTWIKKDNSQWVKAEEVNGLMQKAAQPSTAFFCNHCGKSIAKPPSRCERCEVHVDNPTQKLVHHDLDEIDRKARKALAKAKIVSVATASNPNSMQSSMSGARGQAFRETNASGIDSVQKNSQDTLPNEKTAGWLKWLRGKKV
jgi:hypothetical protein